MMQNRNWMCLRAKKRQKLKRWSRKRVCSSQNDSNIEKMVVTPSELSVKSNQWKPDQGLHCFENNSCNKRRFKPDILGGCSCFAWKPPWYWYWNGWMDGALEMACFTWKPPWGIKLITMSKLREGVVMVESNLIWSLLRWSVT